MREIFSLIVRETDRLSKSVTQLLSFASKQPPATAPCSTDELLRSVARLFRADAGERNLSLQSHAEANASTRRCAGGALRDALANLLQMRCRQLPAVDKVTVESFSTAQRSCLRLPTAVRASTRRCHPKIWEPFFTTRQRATGLGLAIVRKRMEDAGGSARLVPSHNSKGARFELRLPVLEA